MRSIITGTGIGIPKIVIKNEVLSQLMDTNDEWIQTRSGVRERRFVEDGQGSAELGVIAAQNALAAAGKTTEDIDAIVFATMTPNFYFPGNGPLMQAQMGFPETIPTFDIRQQCSGFLYGLELCDSLLKSGKYKRLLLVGADVHTPVMPWTHGYDITLGKDVEVTPEDVEFNNRYRHLIVLFGDGAGAVVIEASDDESSDGKGYLTSRLFTNGSNVEALYMRGGSKRRPWVRPGDVESGDLIPDMQGREVFKEAVSKMPDAVRAVCERAGVTVADIDILLVHQANLRIVEAVAKQLGMPPEKVPHNIERYGNTTAGTLPILFHESVENGTIKPGMLVCFTALGSGLHWGAALYRT